ncbi:MAG: ABC transporter substrate-binding protein [Alphaproteobacteria bacterium]
MKEFALARPAALAAAALLLAPAATPAAAQEVWRIGEVAPLSGPAATVGTRLNKVTKMWVEEANAKGGIAGRKIELTTCNDENKPEKAVACARDMIEKGAVIIFGNALTASLMAIQPLVKSGPILLIPSPNVVPGADTYGFQVSPSDVDITEAIADFLKANKLDKIGMVAATDASGEVGVASARKVFTAEKIELRLARIDLRATDASTQLARVAGSDIKVVYSSYTGGGAITVVKSYMNLGLTQPLIVSYGNISDAFVQLVKGVKPPRLLGTGVAGIVPETVKDPGDRARSQAFLEAYAKRYSERPDMINLLGKAAVDVAEAILKTPDPKDYPAVKKFLESTPIPSVHTQRFSAKSHVGLDASSVIIVELKGETWVKADPVK